MIARLIILLISSCIAVLAHTQTIKDSTIDVASIKQFMPVLSAANIVIDSSCSLSPATAIQKKSSTLPTPGRSKRLSPKMVAYCYFLKIPVINNSGKTITTYFHPGFYFTDIKLYKVKNDIVVPVSNSTAIDGYRKFILEPCEKTHILAYLKPLKNEFNSISPTLVEESFIEHYQILLVNNSSEIRNFSYVLSGVLLMMILFMITSFIINKKKEFLFNALYSLSMFLLIFLNAHLIKQASWFSNLYLSYIDFFLLLMGTLFYILFVRTFLNTRLNYILLDKILKIGYYFIIILLAVYTYLHFFTSHYQWQYLLENIMKFVMLLIGLSFIILAIKHRSKLFSYLAAGNAAVVIFSAISLGIILSKLKPIHLYTNALFYYYIGIALELIFFLTGLNYKNKNELIQRIKEQEAMKLEAEKKEFETQIAIIKAQQEERERISADMHDDLGAGMTTIRLYSELAKNKLAEHSIPEIDKISASSNELLNKMNAIIWSMASSNDSLGNMISYIRSYALEYFENTSIDCQISIPQNLSDVEITGEVRRNIFLVVKEALNNVLKHSSATIVTLRLVKVSGGLTLYIQDNGIGINFESMRQFSNGLRNMRKRMADVGIEFNIENNNGTLISLHGKIEGF